MREIQMRDCHDYKVLVQLSNGAIPRMAERVNAMVSIAPAGRRLFASARNSCVASMMPAGRRRHGSSLPVCGLYLFTLSFEVQLAGVRVRALLAARRSYDALLAA
jgi:hypothetical protein